MNASNPNSMGTSESATNDQHQSIVVIARWAIFAINLLYYSLDCYANWRQYQLYKQHKEMPAEIAELVPDDRYAKDRRHRIALLLVQMFYRFPCMIFITMAILFSSLIFWLWKFAAESIGQGLLHTDNELVHVIIFSFLLEACIMPSNYIGDMFNKVFVARKWPTLEQLEERQIGMSPQPSLLTSTLIYLKQEFYSLFITFPLCMGVFYFFILWFDPSNVALAMFSIIVLVSYASFFIYDFIFPTMLSKILNDTPLMLHECALKREMERMCNEEGVKLEGEGIFVSDDAHYVQLDGGWFSGWFSRAKLLLDERLLSKEFMEQVYSHNTLGLEKPKDLNKAKEEARKKIEPEKDEENEEGENSQNEEYRMAMMNNRSNDEADAKILEEGKKSIKPGTEEEEAAARMEEEPMDNDNENHYLQTKVDKGMKKLPRKARHQFTVMSGLRRGKRPGKVAPKLSLTRRGRENDGVDDDDEEDFLKLSDEELLGLLAVEIGTFKEIYTLRYWMMRKIGLFGQLATLFCLLHFTWRQPWFFGVLHFPADYEQQPLLLSITLCFTLLLTPVHKLQNGLVQAAEFFHHTRIEVASAIRLGRARQFRAALLKIGWECDYGLGDWLYCLLNPSERPECPPPIKQLAKHLEKEEQIEVSENPEEENAEKNF